MPIGLGIGISVGASAQARGGAVAPFSPANIAGLQLWLDATTGLFDATSGGSPVTTDGSAVARWEDQSGNTRHAIQATEANRPILKTAIKNNKNVIRLDGASDSLKVNAFSLTTKRTIFYALSSTSNTTQILCEQSTNYNDNNKLGIFLIDNGTTFFAGYRDSGNYSAKNFTTRISGSIIIQTRYNDTHASNKMSQNGQDLSESSIFTSNVSGSGSFDLFIGARAGNSLFFNGDLYEILIYNEYLADSNISSITNYLNTKWAIY